MCCAERVFALGGFRFHGISTHHQSSFITQSMIEASLDLVEGKEGD